MKKTILMLFTIGLILSTIVIAGEIQISDVENGDGEVYYGGSEDWLFIWQNFTYNESTDVEGIIIWIDEIVNDGDLHIALLDGIGIPENGTELANTTVINGTLDDYAWNTILFDTPYTISADAEYWIGLTADQELTDILVGYSMYNPYAYGELWGSDSSEIDAWLWDVDADMSISILTSCTPDWYCSLYGDCQTDDKRYCIEAIDNNSCGQEFSGNLTADFTPQTCDYCTPSWSCSSIQSDCPVNKVKECYAVADANDCYAQTALSSDQFNGSLITYNSECGYVAGYTTANLRDETVDIGANSMLEVIALMAVLVAIVVAGVVDARIKRLKWW
jgi:hypothetical protein